MSSSLLCGGGITWGASLFVAQSIEWKITLSKSSTSSNWGLLLNGLGGVIAVPFIESFGRYPIWVWLQIITLALVIGTTLSPEFATFTAFRSLRVAFGTIPQVVGLPMIHDMYSPEGWFSHYDDVYEWMSWRSVRRLAEDDKYLGNCFPWLDLH